jgi:SNF2 family DNA or RNA helicase
MFVLVESMACSQASTSAMIVSAFMPGAREQMHFYKKVLPSVPAELKAAIDGFNQSSARKNFQYSLSADGTPEVRIWTARYAVEGAPATLTDRSKLDKRSWVEDNSFEHGGTSLKYPQKFAERMRPLQPFSTPGLNFLACQPSCLLFACGGKMYVFAEISSVSCEDVTFGGTVARDSIPSTVNESTANWTSECDSKLGKADALKPYQKRCVSWLMGLERTGGFVWKAPSMVDAATSTRIPTGASSWPHVRIPGAIMAHPVGMGKTLQVLALCAATSAKVGATPTAASSSSSSSASSSSAAAAAQDPYYMSGPPAVFPADDIPTYADIESEATLVLCPSHLVAQWKEEIQKWLPSWRLNVDYTGIASVHDIRRVTLPALAKMKVIIVSYSFLANRYPKDLDLGKDPFLGSFGTLPAAVMNHPFNLHRLRYRRLVLDEYHELSNLEKTKTEHVNVIRAFYSRFTLLLSGTPTSLTAFDVGLICGAHISIRKEPLFFKEMVDLLNYRRKQRVRNSWRFQYLYSNGGTVPEEDASASLFLTSEMHAFAVLGCRRDTQDEIKLPDPIYVVNKVDFTPHERVLYLTNRDHYTQQQLLRVCSHFDALQGQRLEDIDSGKIRSIDEVANKTQSDRVKKIAGYTERIDELVDRIQKLNNPPARLDGQPRVVDKQQIALLESRKKEYEKERETLQRASTFFENVLSKLQGQQTAIPAAATAASSSSSSSASSSSAAAPAVAAVSTPAVTGTVASPTAPAASDNKEIECPICLGTIEASAMVTECGHVFCTECMEMALTTNEHQCAVCRAAISRASVYRIALGTVPTNPDEVQAADLVDVDRYGSKIGALVKFIHEHPGEKMLVFVQWTDLLKKVQQALQSLSVDTMAVRGNVFVRNTVLRKFKKTDTSNVLLVSMEDAASGTNLTVAKHCVLLHPMDEWLSNPDRACAYERQAVGRVHRLGQENIVQVHRFLINDSVESSLPVRNPMEGDLKMPDVEQQNLAQRRNKKQAAVGASRRGMGHSGSYYGSHVAENPMMDTYDDDDMLSPGYHGMPFMMAMMMGIGGYGSYDEYDSDEGYYSDEGLYF